jgi:hypothetical protein
MGAMLPIASEYANDTGCGSRLQRPFPVVVVLSFVRF